MMYCPRCGSKIKEDESYCVICGAQLPKDIDERTQTQSGLNRWWLTPIVTLVCVLIAGIGLHFYLEYNNSSAQSLYDEGVEHALEGQYNRAQSLFEEAIDYNPNFEAAQVNSEFMTVALEINEKLNNVDTLVDQGAFQQAVQITEEAESQLNSYNGDIINHLLESILDKRNEVRITQVEQRLAEEPGIEELKILLWQTQSIEHNEAEDLENLMKERIVSRTANEANDKLQTNQFTAAISIVEDGLRYVPENERLDSLKTTISNQQADFETQQQERIEQALTQYESEQEQNENDAVELNEIEVTVNDYDEVNVYGELTSVATRPIHSISVQYVLLDDDEDEILENETFVFPDTLYPDETGQIDHTHSDLPDDFDSDEVSISVEQISWFLDGQED
ncbi:zinc ribbon domain-containing protein [Alkalibacillus silvisoli]|uniref:Zinc-ribbon domain-containing protein n=1 Tax=Alkalibacillus silvisoli TaxID=392823 RepID=A0ABN0ZNN3_9BACI